MDWIYRIVVGVLLIGAGLAYLVLRIMADAAGDPDEGFLGGFGPLLAGLAVAAVGIVILFLH